MVWAVKAESLALHLFLRIPVSFPFPSGTQVADRFRNMQVVVRTFSQLVPPRVFPRKS